MIRRSIKKLLADQQGANLIEFAIALPVLVLLIYGIFVFGMVLQANAGMQHALGEAARFATIYPTPSDSQIQARITAEEFGLQHGTLDTPTIATNTAARHKTITLRYQQPTDFLFFPGPTVTLVRSKRVYYSS